MAAAASEFSIKPLVRIHSICLAIELVSMQLRVLAARAQNAAAVRAAVLHLLGASGAERALVRACEPLFVCAETRTAALALLLG